MPLIKNINSTFKAALVCSAAIALVACGGGSSNSGGPTAPPPPALPLFNVGEYTGTTNVTSVGENVADSSDEPSPFSVEVAGTVAGNQQVRIAFLQFSGTSAIGPDGGFSIPSGSFRIRIRERSGAIVTTCTGQLLFEGRFSSATMVSGNTTTTSPFVCTDSRFGPITLTGPFEATFGAAKRGGLSDDLGIIAAD